MAQKSLSNMLPLLSRDFCAAWIFCYLWRWILRLRLLYSILCILARLRNFM